jgi:hypothetical protein
MSTLCSILNKIDICTSELPVPPSSILEVGRVEGRYSVGRPPAPRKGGEHRVERRGVIVRVDERVLVRVDHS